MVNWKTMCFEKKRGGLGVRNIFKMNQALLCKWNWRFAIDREPLWRIVINVKFGEMVGGWTTGDIKGSFGIGLWKEIKKNWATLSQNASFSLGDDRRLRGRTFGAGR